MKFTVTFKSPDAFDQVKFDIKDELNDLLEEGTINDAEYDQLLEERTENAKDVWKKFVGHGENITVVFDTIGTANVIEVKR